MLLWICVLLRLAALFNLFDFCLFWTLLLNDCILFGHLLMSGAQEDEETAIAEANEDPVK